MSRTSEQAARTYVERQVYNLKRSGAVALTSRCPKVIFRAVKIYTHAGWFILLSQELERKELMLTISEEYR